MGTDHQLKVLIVTQILPISTLRNVERTVWRIYIQILGCKGLKVGMNLLAYLLLLSSIDQKQ